MSPLAMINYSIEKVIFLKLNPVLRSCCGNKYFMPLKKESYVHSQICKAFIEILKQDGLKMPIMGKKNNQKPVTAIKASQYAGFLKETR